MTDSRSSREFIAWAQSLETIVLIANIAFMPFVWTNPSMLPGAWAAANAGGTDAVLPAGNGRQP